MRTSTLGATAAARQATAADRRLPAANLRFGPEANPGPVASGGDAALRIAVTTCAGCMAKRHHDLMPTIDCPLANGPEVSQDRILDAAALRHAAGRRPTDVIKRLLARHALATRPQVGAPPIVMWYGSMEVTHQATTRRP